MKYISHEPYGIQCPKCNGELMLEKVRWSELKGSLYYIFCPCCNIKGDGANNRITALSKFEKAIVHKEKLENRKPEKILTDIRDYLNGLLEEWNGADVHLDQISLVEKQLANLTEYSEKLGVEL